MTTKIGLVKCRLRMVKFRLIISRPWVTTFGKNVTLRNLRDKSAGAEMRVDIALQGPKSRDILLSLGCDSDTRKRIMKLKRTELCEAIVGGFDLVVSRTGYTGEKMAFELFIHPDLAPAFWDDLKSRRTFRSQTMWTWCQRFLRTEAGLPLYGHEMGGDLNLGVSEANFGSFVKTYKPWFIGRSAYLNVKVIEKISLSDLDLLKKASGWHIQAIRSLIRKGK